MTKIVNFSVLWENVQKEMGFEHPHIQRPCWCHQAIRRKSRGEDEDWGDNQTTLILERLEIRKRRRRSVCGLHNGFIGQNYEPAGFPKCFKTKMLLKVNFWKLCPNILLQAPSKVIIHYKKYFIMQLFFLAILEMGLWEGIKAPLKLVSCSRQNSF